jgi:hypothetical protein
MYRLRAPPPHAARDRPAPSGASQAESLAATTDRIASR